MTPRDTHERLQGVLWAQTSAEYWALSHGTYNDARVRLDAALGDTDWTAALEQTGHYATLPAAVILDLDETVLDNTPASGQLVLDRTDYTPQNWDAWVEKEAATALPGAKEFIAYAKGRGVRAFFVTNRTAAEQQATIKNLTNLGIEADDATVLCTGENGWTSDKTLRRAAVAKDYRVLLLIGDDLNDFASTKNLTVAERLTLAKTHASKWGQKWVLLPNPIYGSWDRALYPGLTADKEILERKRQETKGFKP